MAILNVNPTRMQLMNLKLKHKSAKRGHKMLKDKQDGLMQKFMEIIREAKAKREEVEEKLGAAFKNFVKASSIMSQEFIEAALMYSTAKMDLDVKTKNVMSVRIPQFKLKTEGEVITYGYAHTSGELDFSLQAFLDILPTLLELAEIEKSAEAIADELEKTRRRVNALEHRMIPDLEETMKFISMKLGELERSAITNTMRIKSQIEEQEKKLAMKQAA